MKNLLYVLASLAVFVNTASSQGYCQLPSCKGPYHTLCKFTSPKPAAICGEVQSIGLSKTEIQQLVKKHNYYRKFVASGKEKRGKPGPQPAASNLGPLLWDKKLAKIAQRWANQCDFNHDTCRDVTRWPVGQCLAIESTIGPATMNKTVGAQVTRWYNEVAKFDRRNVRAFNPSNFLAVGHYTQMVWAKTTLVGCGAIRYKTSGWDRLYLVCNYGPTGNWNGKEMYKSR